MPMQTKQHLTTEEGMDLILGHIVRKRANVGSEWWLSRDGLFLAWLSVLAVLSATLRTATISRPSQII